jgi:uncharacterized protein (TIGR02246 family)
MSKNLFLATLALFTLLNTACQQAAELKPVTQEASKPDMAKIKAEIQAIENTWAAASNAEDVATIVGFYADDAISMSDDQPMTVGKVEIQKMVQAEMARHKADDTVVFKTLDVYGDETCVTEVGKTTVTDAAGKVIYGGKYMAVWEKRDGKWLTIRDIVNDDAK